MVLSLIFNRPHDRVALKDMKADWRSCLDSKLGFKVKGKQPLLEFAIMYFSRLLFCLDHQLLLFECASL